MNDKGMLIVLSGPSGAGKGTICKELIRNNPELQVSISATTRSPRKGEVDGVNYFFKPRQEFLEMIANNQFLEHAVVYDYYYGTPKSSVFEQLEQGRDIILEIDIQGACQVKERYEEGIFIFILPPSMDVLMKRITSRGTETPEDIQKRMECAYKEISFIKKYNNMYGYVVLNDKISTAAEKIKSIITAEKCRINRNIRLFTELTGGSIL